MISTPTKNIQITKSVGAAITVPGQSPKDIFAKADGALYEVKSAGRNGFRIVSPSPPALESAQATCSKREIDSHREDSNILGFTGSSV
ncbi:hypothetical protein ACXHXG_24255 [Rhizobium sp. LEGMi198b]